MRLPGLEEYDEASDPEGQTGAAAFQQALEQLGWRVGYNVEIIYRWTAGDANRAETLARELVAATPDILVINATASVIATRRATATIPIVMVAVADPVEQGFVQSLERPGGSISGFAVEEPTMGAKWIELLKEIAPVKYRTCFDLHVGVKSLGRAAYPKAVGGDPGG
jgi:putative tryptophan/tyrosine transport system substrate-binding protein